MPDKLPPTALVTGGTNGIGRAIAAALGASGMRVFICGRTQETVELAVKDLRSDGITAAGEQCDITQPDQVRRMVSACADVYGPVKVLVNNAGQPGGGVTAQIADDVWLNAINTNLNGTFFVTRAVLNEGRMLQHDDGRIITIASAWGKQGVRNGAPYSAAKHGVIGFTRCLALELASSGITVNAVCPGYVETPMAQNVRRCHAGMWGVDEAEVRRRVNAEIPIGRYSEPAEVAGMVAYLASGQAASVTGQALNVCGGLGYV
jgi:ketoreductase